MQYDYIGGLAALATSPLRSLEALHLTGAIHEQQHLALGGEAPAFRSLKRLTLTPDNLTPEAARRIAASPSLAALQALPSLKLIRLTMPYQPIEGVGIAVQLAALAALGDGAPVSIAEGLFAEEVMMVALAGGSYDLEWDLPGDFDLPPAAVWAEALHQKGAAHLKGDDSVLLEDVDLSGLVDRWGAAKVEAFLRERGAEADVGALLRSAP